MAPLLTRKRDCAYLLFFITHIPIIFLIDTVPLQPSWLRTELSAQFRGYYVATYRDKFFEDPAPVWFSAFIWMELLYHVPASLWAAWGLIRGMFIQRCGVWKVERMVAGDGGRSTESREQIRSKRSKRSDRSDRVSL
jgi:hypothetical protein